jgi:DNA-binding IclR family transcriptional regulator
MQDGSAARVSNSRSARRERTREGGLARAMQVLDFLHAHGRPIPTGVLARGLGAPRSTIYNLVRTMAEQGVLDIGAGDGRVFFGRKLYLWGMDWMRENALVRQGRQAVDRLAAETGETAELCMLHEGRYTIVHMCPGARPFRISSAVGLQIPLPWTASGRLLLSGMDRASIDRLVADADLVLPDGRRIDRQEFHAEIAAAASRGHCITSGLVDAVSKCLAVPIRAGDGGVAATLCFVLPIDTPQAQAARLIALLREHADSLSLDLEAA